MTKDIAPELLNKIEQDFDKAIAQNADLKWLQNRLEEGLATYEEALEYAEEIGNTLSEVLRKNITEEILPDGKLYYNIAKRILPGPMRKAYEMAAGYAGGVQEIINKSMGLGMKNVKHQMNRDKVEHLIDIVSGKDKFGKVAYMLDAPLINLCQSAVDMTIKANAEFHFNAGLEPKIRRFTDGNCCEWCSNVAGTYTYPNVPHDVYRRHKRCSCIVLYMSGDKHVQGVHSKRDYGSLEEGLKSEDSYLRGLDSLSKNERKDLARQRQKAYRLARKASSTEGAEKVRAAELARANERLNSRIKAYEKRAEKMQPIIKNSSTLKFVGTDKPLKENPQKRIESAKKRKKVDSMNRTELEEEAREIFIKREMAKGLDADEAERRFKLLIDNNPNTYLRKYVKKYG